MKRIGFLCWMILCTLSLYASREYVIIAHIKGIKNGTVFFLKKFDNQRIINSATVEKGTISMRGILIEPPQHLWLCTTINEEFHYCDILLDRDTLYIEGDIKDFPNGLRFKGARTHMEYATYLEQTHDLNKRIDSLNNVSLFLHQMGAVGRSKSGRKKSSSGMRIATELPVDIELNAATRSRDSIRLSFISKNMDKPAGQFLLTRIMKQLSPDSIRMFYRLIPVEMKMTKFVRIISNFINPYADNAIRQADDLLSIKGKEDDLNKYAEEAYNLYEKGVRLDPDRTDGYIALSSMYERLLPVKGLEAFDISITNLQKFIDNTNVSEEDREMARSKIKEISYRKHLASTVIPEMVPVKGGRFTMGSTYPEDNNPPHTVTVKSFNISKYEITNYQFAEFLKAYDSRVVKEGDFAGEPLYIECNWGIQHNVPVKGFESHPAIYITWFGAQEYCKWIGGRLPSEEEWEFAARGGIYGNRDNFYSGSMSLDSVGWYAGNSEGRPHPIGTLQPNELGLYDMSGNVWEWCSNTVTIEGKLYAPVRGGTWFNDASGCRSTCRTVIYPSSKHFNNGFRIVKDE